MHARQAHSSAEAAPAYSKSAQLRAVEHSAAGVEERGSLAFAVQESVYCAKKIEKTFVVAKRLLLRHSLGLLLCTYTTRVSIIISFQNVRYAPFVDRLVRVAPLASWALDGPPSPP